MSGKIRQSWQRIKKIPYHFILNDGGISGVAYRVKLSSSEPGSGSVSANYRLLSASRFLLYRRELLHNSEVKRLTYIRYIIGIDEVGRGPLAGPVAVCALAATPHIERHFRGIKDSKQLSEAEREEWFRLIKLHRGDELRFAVSMVSAKEIDKHGITPAIRKALASSLKKLGINPALCEVRLDGGLKAPPEYKKQKTIIKGDEKERVIGMASIVAKVTRDRLMIRLDKKYPDYNIAEHKGYGTALHIAAISRLGLTEIHRRSFCGNIKITKKPKK